MQGWPWLAVDLLWRTALVAVPLTLLVAAICRWLPCRPATRHMLWLTALLWFVVSPLLPRPPFERLVAPALSDGSLGKGTSPEPAVTNSGSLSDPRDAGTLVQRTPNPSARTAQANPPLADRAQAETLDPTTTVPRTVTRTEPLPSARLAPTSGSGGLPANLEPAAPNQTESRLLGMSPWVRIEPSEPDHPAPRSAGPVETNQATPAPPIIGRSGGQSERDRTRLRSQWLAELARVRAALGSLPTFPVSIWLGGTLLYVAAGVGHLFGFRRRLRGAYLAPASVRRMVTHVARAVGLSNVPEVLMIQAPLSPMIWCGRPARLVLPTDLWEQLDHPERMAILCHELAHLRRWDHRVRWAELMVTALYWWFPVVWWVRRRLHEEADVCCDTWVTWLMPRGRRAYAEALLHTKRYVSRSAIPMPAVGMAVTTGRARRFARRLTMLMTQSSKPGLSVHGIVLAVTLAMAGWIATPAQSSPPPDKAPCPEATEASATPVFLVSGDDRDLEKRVARLEKQMQKLVAKLDGLLDALSDRDRREPQPPRTPRPPKEASPIEVPKGEFVVRAYELPPGKLEALTELMVRDDVPVLVRPMNEAIEVHATEADQAVFKAFVNMIHPPVAKTADEVLIKARKGEHVDRTYRLPEGKLEALTELMVRDDVPILVRPLDDGIEVQATKAHQAVFKAFVNMIHPPRAKATSRPPIEAPKGEVMIRAYKLSPGKLEALTKLMVREDVPVLVQPMEDHIEVHGTRAQHAVFEAFVNMIEPSHDKPHGAWQREKRDKKASEEYTKREAADRSSAETTAKCNMLR